jgi:DNA end-binding protein Ku
VPRADIDQRFFDTPYYVTPNDPVGQEAFAVVREAMCSKALVALGRIVLSERERVIPLEPHDKGFIGTTLRYQHEVRDPKDCFADIPELTPAPELLRLAAYILDSKLMAFDPSAFRDHYVPPPRRFVATITVMLSVLFSPGPAATAAVDPTERSVYRS